MTRRPFLGVCLCLLIGVLLTDYIPISGIVGLFVMFIIGVVVLRNRLNINLSIILLVVLVVGMGIGIRSVNKLSLKIPEERIGKIVTLDGVLYGINHTNNKFFTFKVDNVKFDKIEKEIYESYKVIIKRNDKEELNGQRISLTIVQDEIEKPSNPGDFNYRSYLHSQGYKNILFVDSNEIKFYKGKVKSYKYYIEETRHKIYLTLLETLKLEDANMLFGIILGDTSFIDKEVKDSFLNTGIAHILAMSGLHFGIIYLWLIRIKKSLKVHGENWRYFVLMVLWIVALLNGLKPSAFRAVLMLSAILIAPIFNRRYDILNIMGLIGCLSIVFKADVIYQPGFQLSYMAVLSIVFISPWLKTILPYKDSSVMGTLIVIFSVQIGMWPVLAYHYNYHSVVGYILNIPAVYLTGIIVPVGMLHLLLAYLVRPVAFLTEIITRVLIFLLIECSLFMKDNLYQGFYMKTPEFGTIILYMCFLFFVVWNEQLKRFFIRNREGFKNYIIVIPISLFLMLSTSSKDLELLFFDVGQGDSTLIKHYENSILIDTGEAKEKIYSKLLKNNTDRLEYLVLSHTHTDHAGGAVELIQKLKVKKLVLSTFYKDDLLLKEIVETAKVKGVEIIWLNKGDILSLPNGLQLKSLYPNFDTLYSEDKINDYSMVIELKYKDFECVFTGDIEASGEENLVEIVGSHDVDVLKVPHHGSKTSSSVALINAFTPEIAVIQVGTNRYGHPNRDIIDRYNFMGAETYRTDKSGAISIKTNGFKMGISTYLK